MKIPKQKWIWALVIAIVLIIVLVIWYFWPTSVKDPNQNNTPVPSGSPTPKWVPETFPLNIGMFGPKIKELQKALGFPAKTLIPGGKYQDGYFGSVYTQPAIIAKGYSVPLSLADYNSIITSNGGSAAQNIAGAYAKFDGVAVYYISDSSLYKKFNKDQWIGKISGEDIQDDNYWDIDGLYKVYKNSIYQKA